MSNKSPEDAFGFLSLMMAGRIIEYAPHRGEHARIEVMLQTLLQFGYDIEYWHGERAMEDEQDRIEASIEKKGRAKVRRKPLDGKVNP